LESATPLARNSKFKLPPLKITRDAAPSHNSAGDPSSHTKGKSPDGAGAIYR
jgi:hypothetical protein